MNPAFGVHSDPTAAPSPHATGGALTARPPAELSLGAALQQHWPEYLMEAAELAVFMISASVFVTLLEHPSSPARSVVTDPTLRRLLTGIAMGLTAIAIIYSPWGKQSGAHFNPAVTVTFWRLGKVAAWDAAVYIVAQFAGAVVGILLAAAVLGGLIADPTVNYVATLPGPGGPGSAFAAEFLMAFGLMAAVLMISNAPRLARYTGLCAGALVATYISVEAPLSGMSINPARTFAPALIAHMWDGLWVYFTAPPLGMLLAAQVYLGVRGAAAVECAKLDHQNEQRCIFCGKQESETLKAQNRNLRRSAVSV